MEVISQLLLSGSLSAWGMAPNKTYVGLEMLGMGTVRLQENGFKTNLLIRVIECERVFWFNLLNLLYLLLSLSKQILNKCVLDKLSLLCVWAC